MNFNHVCIFRLQRPCTLNAVAYPCSIILIITMTHADQVQGPEWEAIAPNSSCSNQAIHWHRRGILGRLQECASELYSAATSTACPRLSFWRHVRHLRQLSESTSRVFDVLVVTLTHCQNDTSSCSALESGEWPFHLLGDGVYKGELRFQRLSLASQIARGHIWI